MDNSFTATSAAGTSAADSTDECQHSQVAHERVAASFQDTLALVGPPEVPASHTQPAASVPCHSAGHTVAAEQLPAASPLAAAPEARLLQAGG